MNPAFINTHINVVAWFTDPRFSYFVINNPWKWISLKTPARPCWLFLSSGENVWGSWKNFNLPSVLTLRRTYWGDYSQFLDIHCSDWTNEPSSLFSSPADIEQLLFHYTQQRETFKCIQSFLCIIGRRLGIRILPFIFANCTENHTQFLLLAYDSTSGRLRCKNMQRKFFVSSAAIGDWSPRNSALCHSLQSHCCPADDLGKIRRKEASPPQINSVPSLTDLYRKSREVYAGTDDPLVVVGIHADRVGLQVERELAVLDLLQLILVKIRPSPDTSVDHMRKPFPTSNLPTVILRTLFTRIVLLTCNRPSRVLWIVTHLVGWVPFVVTAVIKASSSSRFSFNFLTNDSMALLLNVSLSPPCLKTGKSVIRKNTTI